MDDRDALGFRSFRELRIFCVGIERNAVRCSADDIVDQRSRSAHFSRRRRATRRTVRATGTFLPVPDRSRVTGVALGGKDNDTLLAFCGNKIWKRKVQQHAMGAFTPWTKVGGAKLERTRAF